ncbi:MAG TPA: VF530 family protein [Burkholderiaceae bacterium]|jgi:uncharacterized protein (DUF2132 family)|nr:VF530 family protein [Burkholderiaceae bacterium]
MSSRPASPTAQPRNPLHGLTLEAIVAALVAKYGWDGLARRAPMRCFSHDPSMGSSLKFLRRTPWAREKVEQLYLAMPPAKPASAPAAETDRDPTVESPPSSESAKSSSPVDPGEQ